MNCLCLDLKDETNLLSNKWAKSWVKEREREKTITKKKPLILIFLSSL